jgi:hypothetical protein
MDRSLSVSSFLACSTRAWLSAWWGVRPIARFIRFSKRLPRDRHVFQEVFDRDALSKVVADERQGATDDPVVGQRDVRTASRDHAERPNQLVRHAGFAPHQAGQ